MKIGVVGSGMVGASAAYALVMRGVGREIVLVDKFEKRALAEADDIFHAVPFAHPMSIRAGSYADLAGARVVIMAAGVSQKPGETRLELLGRNTAVFNEVIPQIVTHAPDAILVVATNPVDVMTHLTTRIAAAHGIAGGRIFGSGTTLDTARFRALLSRRLGVDTPHIHAYVVGEHGDSEVLGWSQVEVGGLTLAQFCAAQGFILDDAERNRIDDAVRHAAYRIIEGKGATYYGIGSALARIAQVVLGDQRAIMTICAPAEEIAGTHDVTVSMPHILGGAGVLARLPIALDEAEHAALTQSVSIVKQAIDSLPGGGG
ncbi:MAG: L-lactate dehydrogenase [Anaerolineae bacterium]|nr:L-lactate dehydrogenase [Anaerolineae bacterium]